MRRGCRGSRQGCGQGGDQRGCQCVERSGREGTCDGGTSRACQEGEHLFEHGQGPRQGVQHRRLVLHPRRGHRRRLPCLLPRFRHSRLDGHGRHQPVHAESQHDRHGWHQHDDPRARRLHRLLHRRQAGPRTWLRPRLPRQQRGDDAHHQRLGHRRERLDGLPRRHAPRRLRRLLHQVDEDLEGERDRPHHHARPDHAHPLDARARHGLYLRPRLSHRHVHELAHRGPREPSGWLRARARSRHRRHDRLRHGRPYQQDRFYLHDGHDDRWSLWS